MTGSPASSPSSPGTTSLVSAGGVGIRVPSDYRLVVTGEHGASFGRSGTDQPVLLVRDLPVRLTVEAWWQGVVSGHAAVLVDVEEGPDGFRAEHAWLDDDRSITTRTRMIAVPGRSLVVAVAVPTSCLPAQREEVSRILDGVTVDGLPAPPAGAH